MMMNIVSRFIKMLATFPLMPICQMAHRACCHTFFEMQTVSTRTRLPAKKPLREISTSLRGQLYGLRKSSVLYQGTTLVGP
jgi:hypothetical protein